MAILPPPAAIANPFPGLRPFEPDEDHLFFGRDRQTDELTHRLGTARFLAVIGGSGSGKSSLVRAGLVPNLHRGYLAKAGAHWRVALFRPGEAPIRNLAAALAGAELLGTDEGVDAAARRAMIEATLRSGSQGLADAVFQARLPEPDNVLVVVDQFEELFRFLGSRREAAAREEALAFVRLLLRAAERPGVPLYVCLTLRSEYLGDCVDYPGLPEAVNAGQFLVPRMTRDELRAAVTGPVAVGGATIAPGLVTRLLNDAGEAAHQLPVLQHALMRTWDHWQGRTKGEGEIAVGDYEAIGTLRAALSRHAEEAFGELSAGRERALAGRIFQALTESTEEGHGVRRPAAVAELCEICEASQSEVSGVLERFRRRGRTFLMPPPGVPLEPSSVVDLSHEALMRIWGRLREWIEEERSSSALYRRLLQSARLHAEGAESLWRNPQLRLALDWRRRQRPNGAWAGRYGGDLDLALAFLGRSCNAQRARLVALCTVLALIVAAGVVGLTWRARAERARAIAAEQAALQEARREKEKAAELQGQIDLLLEKNPQLRQEAAELRSGNRELSLRILEVEAENRDLDQRRITLAAEQEAMVERRAVLRGDLARLEAEKPRLEAAVAELTSTLEGRIAEQRRKSAELDGLLGENGTLRARAVEEGIVVEVPSRLDRLAAAMRGPGERPPEPEGAEPLRDVESPKDSGRTQELERRLSALREENLLLRMTAEELRRENDRLRAKLKPLEERNAGLKRGVAALEVRIRALTREIADLERKRRAAASTVEGLRSEKALLELEIRQTAVSISRIEGVMRQVRDENEALRRILASGHPP